VPAAAEDDEKVSGCAAFSRVRARAVGGGQDVEETELGSWWLGGWVCLGRKGTNEGGG